MKNRISLFVLAAEVAAVIVLHSVKLKQTDKQVLPINSISQKPVIHQDKSSLNTSLSMVNYR